MLPAICAFLGELKKNHPEKQIVFIENTDFKPEIVTCLDNASKRYGVKLVCLWGIDKDWGHPTPLGMQQISEQIKAALEG